DRDAPAREAEHPAREPLAPALVEPEREHGADEREAAEAERRDPAVVPGEVGDVVGREAERDAEDPRDPGERVERGRGGGHERGATSPARRDLRRRPRGVVAVVTAAARLARARGAAHEPPGPGD